VVKMAKENILELVGQLIVKKTLNAVYKYNCTHKQLGSRNAEDLIYPTAVYPIYVEVQANFKYCMQHKLLKRQDILEFKELLNRCVNLKEFKNEKFSNDCHEIYRKLKNTSISAKNMKCLNKYLKQFRDIEIPQYTEPTTVQYGTLTVVK
jgi:hypothetical protein